MTYIVGIDEVGRGPLAGPVTVGIVVCELSTYQKLKKDRKLPPTGLDSKKLSQTDREKYSKVLIQIVQGLTLYKMRYVVVSVSNKIIDKKGIVFCIKKAINDGIKKLKLNPKNCRVLLDGGLKAPAQFKNQKTIIKGDEKEKIIAWASILAKVSRDKLMVKNHKKYSFYGFGENKGYGTLQHRKAIKKHGLSDLHRMSFCRNINV